VNARFTLKVSLIGLIYQRQSQVYTGMLTLSI